MKEQLKTYKTYRTQVMNNLVENWVDTLQNQRILIQDFLEEYFDGITMPLNIKIDDNMQFHYLYFHSITNDEIDCSCDEDDVHFTIGLDECNLNELYALLQFINDNK